MKLYDNRIDMVRDLIPECGTYGEIGVFKHKRPGSLVYVRPWTSFAQKEDRL